MTCTKIEKRQHKRRKNTQNNTKTQNKKQRYATKNKYKRVLQDRKSSN